MYIDVALEAFERGCCLEIWDKGQCVIVDPQVVGLDEAERPLVLGIDRLNERCAPLARWLLLRLDRASAVDVSGYMSDGPRTGWVAASGAFGRIPRRASAAG